ncbi:single-stranded DNA-binding protein, partial [Carnimonas bestiolae]|uniref:single-stranded DNA-binding protein n=1 Tax=Carnimonas bestiolae TaxID=3402172 RepID=UPI003F4AEFC5
MTVNFNDVGRIGSDAQVRQTQNGTSVASFRLAVDNGFGQNKTTIWLDCAIFGKRAEGSLIQYLTKGAQVQVVGEIGQRQFQKSDGSPGFSITLNVSDLKLIGGQQSNQQTG